MQTTYCSKCGHLLVKDEPDPYINDPEKRAWRITHTEKEDPWHRPLTIESQESGGYWWACSVTQERHEVDPFIKAANEAANG